MKLETTYETLKLLLQVSKLEKSEASAQMGMMGKEDLELFQFIQFCSQHSGKNNYHFIPYELDEEDIPYFFDDVKYKAVLFNVDFDTVYIYDSKYNNGVEGKIIKLKDKEKETFKPEELNYKDLLKTNGKFFALLVENFDPLFRPDYNDLTSNELEGKPIRRFLRLLRPEKKEIIYLYVYAAFNGLVNLSLPVGIQTIIGLIMGAQISTSLVLLITLVIIGVLVSGGLQIMQLWIVEAIQQRIFARSAFEFAYRVPRIRLDAMLKSYPPELMNRFFDTLTIQKGLPKLLIDFSTAVIQIVFGLLLLSVYHPAFVFFGLTLGLMAFGIIRYTGPKGLAASLMESKYKYQVAFWLEEIARTMRVFKLAGDTQLPMKKTDYLVTGYLKARKKHFAVLMNQYGFIVIFKTVITGGLLILGSTLVLQQQINIGQFVAAEIIVILIVNAVEKLIQSIDNIYDLLTAVEKLAGVTDFPLDRDDGLPFQFVDRGKSDGIELDINNLTYYAPLSNKPIIKNIQLHVDPGEKICIAGENASGKSTLLSVVDGLHDNYEGSIAFNGVSLTNINLRSLHNHVAENFSRELVFNGTLYENITLGRKDIPFSQVQLAIEVSGLEKFIQQLPEGLDTVLVPEDRTIPNSETRKIVFARCIAENPKLILLEEFLGVFDNVQKLKVVEYITNNNKATTLAISNDSYFASKCDKVLIMEKGEIKYFGVFSEIRNNPELMKNFN